MLSNACTWGLGDRFDTHCREMVTLRVLLVDDNVLFLNALSQQLARNPGIQVVGSANNGTNGLRLAAELSPDVVIVDLAMPDMTGLEVAQRLKKSQSQSPRVVVVSLYDEPEYRESASLAGADAYVVKDAVITDLMPVLSGFDAYAKETSAAITAV